MADQLVLASVTIDANGVVSGMAQVNAAVDQSATAVNKFSGETRQAASFSDTLVERMFSLRHAAIALLGSFTLAGVILEMTHLTAEILKSTDAWKEASEAAGDYWKKIVEGETQAQAQLRHTADILKAAGVSGGMGSMAEQVRGIVEAKQNIMQLLFGDQEMTSKERAGRATLAEFEVDSLNRALIELQKQSGLSLEAFQKIFKVDLGQGTRAIRVPEDQGGTPRDTKPGTNTPRGAFPATRVPDAGSFDAQFAEFPNELRPFANELDEVDQKVIALTQSAKNWKAQGASGMAETWKSLTDGLKPVNDELLTAQERITKLTKLHDEMSQEFVIGQDMVNAAVAAGVISQGAATRASMAMLAAMATINGMMELAKAVASLAVPDVRAAVLHKIAAGLFFATAAFYGKGAIFGGASGGGGGGGVGYGGGVTPIAAAQNQRAAPNVTVIVQGSMVGTSKEQIQRWVVDAWQKGARDQGGGDAVVASANPW